MRTVTRKAIAAFNNAKPFCIGNTCISKGLTGNVYMSLHGNTIAIKTNTGDLKITNAGWFSNTTKERLNALPGVSISQKKGVWYLNGKQWDGELIDIK